MGKAIFIAIILLIIASCILDRWIPIYLEEKAIKEEERVMEEDAKASAIDVASTQTCAKLVSDSCRLLKTVEVNIYVSDSVEENAEIVRQFCLVLFPGKFLTRDLFKTELERRILRCDQGKGEYVIKFFTIKWQNHNDTYSLFDSNNDGQWDTACHWSNEKPVQDMIPVDGAYTMFQAERLFN